MIIHFQFEGIKTRIYCQEKLEEILFRISQEYAKYILLIQNWRKQVQYFILLQFNIDLNEQNKWAK